MNSELPNDDYPIDDIIIKTPKAVQGGTYSAQLEMNSKPIIIQTPKCKTKKGIHKTSKQIYCDLLFSHDNTNNTVFINWLSKLQEKVRSLILENGDNWFHDNPGIDEIEYNWNNSIRTYKNTNNLIRTFIYKNKSLNKLNIQIYDDNENELHLENIDENKYVICILEIKGLKFSQQSFHLEIFLRQVMILNDKPIFNQCLIKTNNSDELKSPEDVDQPSTLNNITPAEDQPSTLNNITPPEDAIPSQINNITPAEDAIPSQINNITTSEKPSQINNITTSEDLDSQINNITTSENLDSHINNITTSEDVDQHSIVNNIKSPEKPSLLNNIKPTPPEEVDLETLDKNHTENAENELEEIKIDISETDFIKLRNANDVYLDIYKKARTKAKNARNNAIKAYLEVKRIKELYMLDVIDSSDEEENEEIEE
jgi:hypothetical protein